jgi:hypothetical protein
MSSRGLILERAEKKGRRLGLRVPLLPLARQRRRSRFNPFAVRIELNGLTALIHRRTERGESARRLGRGVRLANRPSDSASAFDLADVRRLR